MIIFLFQSKLSFYEGQMNTGNKLFNDLLVYLYCFSKTVEYYYYLNDLRGFDHLKQEKIYCP